jgi:hypothetical protein
MATTPTATTLVTITDKEGQQFSATDLGSTVGIWDHENGQEVAQVAEWAHAAAILCALSQ